MALAPDGAVSRRRSRASTDRRRVLRSVLGAMTVSFAVLVVGIVAGADVLGADVPPVVYLAAPLAVLGLGLLVGAMVGRARWLLAIAIPLALLTALVAAVPQAVRETAGSGVGERR